MKRLLTIFLSLVLLCTCVFALADAQYSYDPAHPYDGGIVGLFHNMPAQTDTASGQYSIYLPEGMQPWQPAIIILTPDNTTAQAFAEGDLGQKWMKVADDNKIGVSFLEPENGKTWNIDKDPDGRDDAAVLTKVYMTMRSKSATNNAAFTMDKSHTTLVGYEQGAAAVIVLGMQLSSEFSGAVAIDAPQVALSSLEAAGDTYSIPWPQDSMKGIEENAYPSKNVQMPIWFINSTDGNADILNYWINTNHAKESDAGVLTDAVYQSEDSLARVWVTGNEKAQDLDEATLWSEFLATTKRFMGKKPGGRLALANDFTQPQYEKFEEEVGGFIRRWMTYVPTTYDASKKTPLVLVMHGYTSSMEAIAEESRWYDVAEENGFILLFAQALVFPIEGFPNIPASTWVSLGFGGAGEGAPDDAAFLKEIIERVKSTYNIDSSRVYATGHSNGAMMSWQLGLMMPEMLAAIAPIGSASAGEAVAAADLKPDILLPVWTMKGEYDGSGAALTFESGNAACVRYWNERNKTDETAAAYSEDFGGQGNTITFTNPQGIPLVIFTGIDNTPHIYYPDQSVSIWDDFFSKYRRGEDGSLYYEGEEVTSGSFAEDDNWITK